MTTLDRFLATYDLDEPFADVDVSGRSVDLHGWMSQSPVFRSLITGLRPQAIVEVGSWLGASAVHMAGILRELGSLDARVLCVDTWLGSAPVLWRRPENRARLDLRHGYPRQFEQFAANVVLTGNADLVRVLPGTSTFAAQFLAEEDVTVDLVYIDGSHEYDDVYRDIAAFWELLTPNGVAFGDDYTADHPGVCAAVARFAADHRLIVRSEGEKWVMAKDPRLLS